MTKAQAAETLKEHIKRMANMNANPIDVYDYNAALDKAIEVLSDKTEYVKRSTYRKLKALYDENRDYYQQLVEDASELKMQMDAAQTAARGWKITAFIVWFVAILNIVLLLLK